MRPLWCVPALLGGCFVEKVPGMFDFRYDRDRVVAVRVWPLVADAAVPRRIDALVLAPDPRDAPPVRVEVCGDRGDMAVWLASDEYVRCFSEPALVDVVAREVPASWTPRPRRYEACPDGVTGLPRGPYDTFADTAETGHTGDTGGEARFLECVAQPLLRVVTGEDVDQASAVTVPYVLDGEGPPPGPDPEAADPRLDVIDGEVVAGGRVLVRFSVAAAWTGREGRDGNFVDEYPEHHWYVEAGTPWGSGVTRGAGFDDAGRAYAQTWIALPDDHHGPLRVAAVRSDPVPVWAETTLVVP